LLSEKDSERILSGFFILGSAANAARFSAEVCK
jgi:hypothetical protein